MNKHIKIDFVSDISCPWCAIALNSLEQALARLGDDVTTEIHFQPFELNPDMPAQGQNIVEHLAQKYGLSPDEIVKNQEIIKTRGAAVDFNFRMDQRTRIYNTFDAHRLLYWAAQQGHQQQLQVSLFQAYFSEGEDPSDRSTLVRLAEKVGLNREQTLDILDSDQYATEVRQKENYYRESNIHSVPTLIINGRHFIKGGQTVEGFEQALQKIIRTDYLN